MKKINCFLFLFLFPRFLFCQQIEIRGNVYDGISFVSVTGASIYNMNTKKFTFSDKDGNFTIIVKKNDTIVASKSIYEQSLIVITEENIEKKKIEIPFFYKTIMLKEIKVFAFKVSYDAFKRDVITKKLPSYYEKIDDSDLSVEEKQRIINSTTDPNLLRNIVFTNPISYLYNKFSKKAKLDNLYRSLVENETEVENLPLKYNREIVKNITGLEGTELQDFMMYCRFGYYDLVAWSSEQIVVNIRRKFNDYEYYKLLEEDNKKRKKTSRH